jgi:hypothetical protein
VVVFLSFLIVCFGGATLLRGRSSTAHLALVAGAAFVACVAYYFLHAL